MVKWALDFSYTTHLGKKVQGWLPLFETYDECDYWMDMLYNLLKHNDISDYIATCHYIT